MKQPPPHPESFLPWRDRPEADTSDEDRAAALIRAALAPDAFPVGLDDRQLSVIREGLNGEHHAPPPFWLRPALVAALLLVSVASVMGYERGWFAPLRERLRFRAIPAVVPEPAKHEKTRAPRSPAAAAAPEGPAHAEGPQADVAPVPSPPAQVSAPAAPRPLAVNRASASPVRKLARVESGPPSTAVVAAQPSAASEEIQALEHAVGLLRSNHDGAAALEALDGYLARFPSGVLVHEARLARVDALLVLDRSDEALRALEELPLDAYRRSTELQLIRGELRGRADCARAEADFTAVLARVRAAAMEERALYGRAACRSAVGNARGAAEDLRRYTERFPNGSHVEWARRWLQNNDAPPRPQP